MKPIKLFIVGLMAMLAACNNQSANTNEKKKMAIIVSTLNNPWFVFLSEAAAAKAKSLGYETKVFDSQNNTALESDHFENAISSGYGAILFNPTDAAGSVANVVKAKNSGIPVFCMDREINSTSAATSQILSDSYTACVEIGKYFVETVGKSGSYVELLGIVSDNNTWNRSKGFHSLVDNYPGLKMVAQQSADFDRNKAMEVLESILQAHPEINAVFCGNDAMAMGAYQALVAAGKADKVKVFGFDGAEDAITAIKEGKIMATAMQFPRTIAETAAANADEYLKGKRDFKQKVSIPVDLVTRENIDKYIAYGKKN